MTQTYADIERDAIEGHVLAVALAERIHQRIVYRRWYRRERALGWPKDVQETLNTAALLELLALRRVAKRAGR